MSTGRSDHCKVSRSGHVKQPPMEGPYRPNSVESKKDDKDQESMQSMTQDTTWESDKITIRHHKGQLYAWISPKEPADQQHRHKSSLLSISSAHIRILYRCMEPTHRTIKTQAGNGAKEGCQVPYKHVSQYQQCDRNARRSSLGNIV